MEGRPMTLAEKILCHNAVGLSKREVEPGQMIVVKVARTLASELTYVGIAQTLDNLGSPPIWRNDRFFLAVDHSVDPRNYDNEVIKKRIDDCKRFADKANLVDYFGPNESILHTEFYRQRAEPGSVIVGADSHSCAHGCVGAFAAGMGAADVVMPLITGKTWLRVPESILIEFTGELPWGMVGKDVMLAILKKFKRNTVALDRVVEFKGAEKLSVDSRFAIANMATEFGAIAGVFPGDERTDAFIKKRPQREGDEKAVYLRADPDAKYAEKLTLDLSTVGPAVAIWPEPDRVALLSEMKVVKGKTCGFIMDENMKMVGDLFALDGIFIGACTTTEEEIILAGLVLEQMMEADIKPKEREEKPYKRRMTPGSKLMLNRLEEIGIADIYRKAGFEIGAPGCSYCLGVAYDKAEAGEVWLSSQNRNFKNRMGPGAIGNVTSACVAAASSFHMSLNNPTPFLAKVSQERLYSLLDQGTSENEVEVSEPQNEVVDKETETAEDKGAEPLAVIKGQAQVFGDSIDTDAIIPAPYIPLRDAELGDKSFALYRPEFVERVKEGRNIVVAGLGFGCGSSREEAVSCLKWAGVQAVVAKSFSFIFSRNLLSLNLVGVCVTDDQFYTLVEEGTELEIDLNAKEVTVSDKKFPFQFSPIQQYIYQEGGVVSMYQKFQHSLFSNLAKKGCQCVEW